MSSQANGRKSNRANSRQQGSPARQSDRRSPTAAKRETASAGGSGGRRGATRSATLGEQTLRERIHQGQVTRPLLRALVITPGVGAEDAVFDGALERIRALHHDSVGAVLRMTVGEDAAVRTRADIARGVAELVAMAWERAANNSAAADKELDAERIARRFVAALDVNGKGDPVMGAYRAAHEDIERTLAIGRAVGQIAPSVHPIAVLPKATQRLYIGNHSPLSWITRMRDRIVAHADRLADAMTDGPSFTTTDRTIAFNATMGVLGDVSGEVVRREYREMTRMLRGLGEAERTQYVASLREYPDGVLMARAWPTVAWAAQTAYPEASVAAGLVEDGRALAQRPVVSGDAAPQPG